MIKTKRWLAVVLLVVVLAMTHPGLAAAHLEGGGFNDEYVYATTRSVNEMDMNPALKLTLFPVTVVLDTALLPFALIAGVVTG